MYLRGHHDTKEISNVYPDQRRSKDLIIRRIRHPKKANISTKENMDAPIDKPIQPPIRAESKSQEKVGLCIMNGVQNNSHKKSSALSW